MIYVYIARLGPAVKIGISAYPYERIRSIHKDLLLLGVLSCPGTRRVERELHERFDKYRTVMPNGVSQGAKEWFRYSPVIQKFVRENLVALDRPKRRFATLTFKIPSDLHLEIRMAAIERRTTMAALLISGCEDFMGAWETA